VTGKTVVPYAAPEAAAAEGTARLSVGRALRLTWGAARSVLQPPNNSQKSP